MELLHTRLPVEIRRDRTLRVKILDACGMTCTFCHNEGTPVLADNLRRPGLPLVDAGRSGRVSIYTKTNGVAFLPGQVEPGAEFTQTLTALRDALDVDELHLTGGEPTLHPQLAELVADATAAGYSVRATSNGENGARTLTAAGKAGLAAVNFSIFGTTAGELAAVQHARYRDPAKAERKIDALKASIDTAVAAGIRVSANIVVPSYEHAPRVRRLLEDYSEHVNIRLLTSLEHPKSVPGIRRILAEMGGEPVRWIVTAGASDMRLVYLLPDGRHIEFKHIRPVRLPDTCSGCRYNNGKDCQEGFYGVRLYPVRGGGYMVGVCLQRMDLCQPVEEFVSSSMCREVVELRERLYRQLATG